eukprot:3651179-Lingulodinium_polyedra.AAC.1
MTGAGVEPIFTRILRCRRAPTVQQALQVAASGQTARPGEIWGREECRDAVFVSLRAGAVPAVFCEARRAGG